MNIYRVYQGNLNGPPNTDNVGYFRTIADAKMFVRTRAPKCRVKHADVLNGKWTMERRNIQLTPHGEDVGYYPKGHHREFDTWFIKRIEIPSGKDGICTTLWRESTYMLDVLSKITPL